MIPGPPHVGYVLVTEVYTGNFGAMVAYTTTRLWTGDTPRGLRIFSHEQAKALGQDKAFVLDLRRIAYIPVDSCWFPRLTSPTRGIIGRASEVLQLELEDAAKEIFRRHPDTVERLGPLWSRGRG